MKVTFKGFARLLTIFGIFLSVDTQEFVFVRDSHQSEESFMKKPVERTADKLKKAIADHDDIETLRHSLATIIKAAPEEYRLAQYFGQCFLRNGEAFAPACREACGVWEKEFRVICAAWAFAYYECSDKAVTDPLMIVVDEKDDKGGETSMSLMPGWKRYYCPRIS
jgi:hypothetical protein